MPPYTKTESGKLILLADVLVPDESGDVREGKAAVFVEMLKEMQARGQSSVIAQCYELVIPGLILSDHIFQGLNRPLYCDGSDGRGEDKLIYSRRASFDYEVEKGKDGQFRAVRHRAPPGRTFVVIASPNIHTEEFDMVDLWIDRWNWTNESERLQGAPVNWFDRYDRKIYSRSGT